MISKGGGANPCVQGKSLVFGKSLDENCMKMKETSIGSANENYCE